MWPARDTSGSAALSSTPARAGRAPLRFWARAPQAHGSRRPRTERGAMTAMDRGERRGYKHAAT
jgi:hypothetical protein